MQQTIIAMNNDPYDEFCLGIIVEIKEKDPRRIQSFNVISALQNAAREFTETEAGSRVMEKTGMNFNWGDLAEYLPDEICERHGVHIIDTFQTDLIVTHNEPLVF